MNALSQSKNMLENRYASLSEEIRHILLEAFIDGQLVPGTRVNDLELAKKLGVSRTPVREALRGLQTLGIIETLPARITRVVKLTAQEFEHAKTVWSSLYRLLLVDIINHVTENHIAEMHEWSTKFDTENEHHHAGVGFRFFDILSSITDNHFLRHSVHTAACRIRLGHHHADDGSHKYLRPTSGQVQKFIEAITHKDLDKAHETLNHILGINPHPVELEMN